MLNKEITFSDRDEYGRKSIADKIWRLLEAKIPISPMVIDGKWGQGKTEFCYKLKNHLDGLEGTKCIYIDAYKNDYIDDPLLTIFSAISSTITNNDKKDNLISKAVPVLSFGVKVLGKASLAWALKQDSDKLADEFENVIKESGNAFFDAVAKKMISDCQKQEENVEALKLALKAATEGENLVIFIDELDRCRPSFAVDLIEKIKHIFDIPSITFILVCNSEQLVAAIHHVYGHIDASDYLNKFILLSVKFSQFNLTRSDRALNSVDHFKQLLSDIAILHYLKAGNTTLHRLLEKLIFENNLSLRQVEKLVTRLKITEISIHKSLNDMYLSDQITRVAIIFLDCFNPKIVDEIERGCCFGLEVSRQLGIASVNLNEDTIDYGTKFLHGINCIWERKSDYDEGQNTILSKFASKLSEESNYAYYKYIYELIEVKYQAAIKDVRLS